MAFKPNYGRDRAERSRAARVKIEEKQRKKDEKTALRKAKRTGRPPKLSAAQLRDIERALKRGPETFGFTRGLWSAGRVRELIERRTGVRYHEDHVWRILHKLNWSCQRPAGRALERDEQAIRRWKKYRWPQIKKKRSAIGEPSSSSTRAD